MMVEIGYYRFENVATEAMARGLFDSLASMIPGWVLSCTVFSFDRLEEGAVLSCNADLVYRRLRFEVAAIFYDRDVEQQRELVIHEFVHGLLAELTRWVQGRLVDPIEGRNEELHSFVAEEYTQLVERATQEVTLVLLPLLGVSPSREDAEG